MIREPREVEREDATDYEHDYGYDLPYTHIGGQNASPAGQSLSEAWKGAVDVRFTNYDLRAGVTGGAVVEDERLRAEGDFTEGNEANEGGRELVRKDDKNRRAQLPKW